MTSFHIRDARTSDLRAVLDLVPRLRAFGSQPLRDDRDLDRAERDALTRAFDVLPLGAALFVAERAGMESLIAGVAYAETATDYFTRERHAHLAILAVSPEMEGQGVGRALMEAVEAWGLRLGYRMVTLNVFAANERARRVYERAGYSPDTIRYAKEIATRVRPSPGGQAV